MNITDVRLKKLNNGSKMKAMLQYHRVTLLSSGDRVIEGQNGLLSPCRAGKSLPVNSETSPIRLIPKPAS